MSQVDNAIFKVPSRYFHDKSEAFGAASKIVSVGHSHQEGLGEGASDENPITLSPLPHDTTADDFEHLVKIILALTLDLATPTNYTLHQWLSVLKLSTAWEFSDIRELAMRSLKDSKEGNLTQWTAILDFCWNRVDFVEARELAVTRVSELQTWGSMTSVRMGRQYFVSKWVSIGLRGLVNAPELPSTDDLTTLGFDTVMKFLYLRDEVVKRCERCGNPLTCDGYSSCRRNSYRYTPRNRCELGEVENHFRDELTRIASASANK
ncbi:hypothetical protein AAF712_000287 [Marasmius tenuissimus]|uniref:Uncharacterized protein n=1 Tax=Marasmius tenuissimus TaxID=585030 RepID=A0ABR3AGH0_9AGAR